MKAQWFQVLLNKQAVEPFSIHPSICT